MQLGPVVVFPFDRGEPDIDAYKQLSLNNQKRAILNLFQAWPNRVTEVADALEQYEQVRNPNRKGLARA
jgi:hypothetical protein